MLGCFSVVMLVAAVVIAAVSMIRAASPAALSSNDYIAGCCCYRVGVQGVYTFIVHVFFASYAAEHIGWAVEPVSIRSRNRRFDGRRAGHHRILEQLQLSRARRQLPPSSGMAATRSGTYSR